MKNLRRQLLSITLLILILAAYLGALTACGDDQVTVGMSVPSMDSPFFGTIAEGAQTAADAAEIELIIVDAGGDPDQQIVDVQELVDQKVDAILLTAIEPPAIGPAVEGANEAAIPVFTIDRPAFGGEVVAHVASENVAGGRLAAEFLCDALGRSGKVVELEGVAGTPAAGERGQGFNDYMSEECPDVAIIVRQSANFSREEGLLVFADILEEEAEIDGLFAHDDDMALGAIDAAKEAGRDGEIIFVGFGATDDGMIFIGTGDLAATIGQQPAVMGQLGLETAVIYLGDESVDSFIPAPMVVVK